MIIHTIDKKLMPKSGLLGSTKNWIRGYLQWTSRHPQQNRIAKTSAIRNGKRNKITNIYKKKKNRWLLRLTKSFREKSIKIAPFVERMSGKNNVYIINQRNQEKSIHVMRQKLILILYLLPFARTRQRAATAEPESEKLNESRIYAFIYTFRNSIYIHSGVVRLLISRWI